MTRSEQRLKKVKRLYPVGTKIISLFGKEGTIIKRKPNILEKNPESYFIDKYGCILAYTDKDSNPLVIFDGKYWAKIIK